jgi:ring-1,2-phenylacetyl-CoA epoxidase subunit PaaA
VPQAEFLGLTIPDPKLRWNEATGHYETSEINWEEFNQVIQGNGPCNKERMDHHKQVHAEGAWVREAAAAYAARKQEQLVEA